MLQRFPCVCGQSVFCAVEVTRPVTHIMRLFTNLEFATCVAPAAYNDIGCRISISVQVDLSIVEKLKRGEEDVACKGPKGAQILQNLRHRAGMLTSAGMHTTLP